MKNAENPVKSKQKIKQIGMKKFYLLIVSLFYALCIFSTEDTEAYKGTKGLEYSFDQKWKVATLTGRGTARGGQIFVPQLVQQNGEDYKVIQVDQKAFSHDSKLKCIVFSEGLNNIGPAAFDSCVNLTQCVLPSTIEVIYDFAFYNCKKLTTINIPDNLGFTGQGSFEGTGITTPLYNDICFMYMPPSFKGRYSIAEGTKKIGGGAFANCTNLYGITIPKSVTWIGAFAFWSCQNLSDVVILNDSMPYLGDALFAGCFSLQSVKLPTCLVEIPCGLFQDCINLRDVSIPQSVKSIGAHAFSRCEQLCDISLPSELESIGDWAFGYCENLNQIALPKSVRFIGNGPFSECNKFTEPVFNDSVFAYLPASFKGKHYTIKNGTKRIAGWAFIECENLETLIVPNSVEEAGECSVTSEMINIPIYNKNIFLFLPSNHEGDYIIPDGIKTIASGAFLECKKMTNVIIPTTVTEIAPKAFENCYSLRRVEIPNKNIIRVAEDAFPSSCTIIWK